MVELTEKEQLYLMHMLGMGGADAPERKRGYRNYYCAGKCTQEDRDLEEMVARGWLIRGRQINDNEATCYHATEAAMDALGMTQEQKRRALA